MNATKDVLQFTKKKAIYKVSNWKQYNQALIQRGSLCLWIGENVLTHWLDTSDSRYTYSDTAIECLMTLKALHHKPLRQLVGFVRSLFLLSGIALPLPNYSTLSRRMKTLAVKLKKTNKKSVSFLVDSTGLKVHGEGEWKVRKHGWNYRRTWKKMHIAMDMDGEVRAVTMTHGNDHDDTVVDELLLEEQSTITGFWGDGAYDSNDVYMSLAGRNVEEVYVPPRKNSVLTERAHPYKQENMKLPRDDWKKQSNYHQRSKVETHMYRHKVTFTPYLDFRTEESQRNEILIKTNILNVFTSLGMPQCYKVE